MAHQRDDTKMRSSEPSCTQFLKPVVTGSIVRKDRLRKTVEKRGYRCMGKRHRNFALLRVKGQRAWRSGTRLSKSLTLPPGTLLSAFRDGNKPGGAGVFPVIQRPRCKRGFLSCPKSTKRWQPAWRRTTNLLPSSCTSGQTRFRMNNSGANPILTEIAWDTWSCI